MIKNYAQRFYPNPFRYRGIKKISNRYEIFERFKEEIKPFLLGKLAEIDEYFDEFFNPKSEVYISRSIRNNFKDKIDKAERSLKSNNLTKSIINPLTEYLESFEGTLNYQKNLRYLELPVYPSADKKGFEIQSLSSDLTDEILEEIETGISYVYEYCSERLPESIELWQDYALLYQNDFPTICHDQILEATYRSLDNIFNRIQKGTINLSSWAVTGDLDHKILKVVEPKVNINYLLQVLGEFLISIFLLILAVNFISSRIKPILNIQQRHLSTLNPKKVYRAAKRSLDFKKVRFEHKLRRLKLHLSTMKLKLNLKHKLLKLLTDKNIL